LAGSIATGPRPRGDVRGAPSCVSAGRHAEKPPGQISVVKASGATQLTLIRDRATHSEWTKTPDHPSHSPHGSIWALERRTRLSMGSNRALSVFAGASLDRQYALFMGTTHPHTEDALDALLHRSDEWHAAVMQHLHGSKDLWKCAEALQS